MKYKNDCINVTKPTTLPRIVAQYRVVHNNPLVVFLKPKYRKFSIILKKALRVVLLMTNIFQCANMSWLSWNSIILSAFVAQPGNLYPYYKTLSNRHDDNHINSTTAPQGSAMSNCQLALHHK